MHRTIINSSIIVRNHLNLDCKYTLSQSDYCGECFLGVSRRVCKMLTVGATIIKKGPELVDAAGIADSPLRVHSADEYIYI